MPNTMKVQLAKKLREARGYWIEDGLVVWNGPRNKGVVFQNGVPYVSFELDPELEGDKLVRFTTRRMKSRYVRQFSRRLTKTILRKEYTELAPEVFDTEKPCLEGVKEEVRAWLQNL
jgi:hypothetical protein